QNVKNALTDYNRENYGVYNQEMPNLPAVVGTYDYFSASAAGLSSSFHINRNGIGNFAPAQRTNIDVGSVIGAEFGFGGLAHLGLDVEVSGNIYQSGKWKNANGIDQNLIFSGSDKDQEGAYFTSFGEQGETDNNFFTQVHNGDLIHTPLLIGAAGAGAANAWAVNNSSIVSIDEPVRRNNRQKRTTSISYLTGAEAAEVGLDKKIEHYPRNQLVCSTCTVSAISEANKLERVTEENTTEARRAPYHISEITITQPDGSRYVYGLPTYNRSQAEVTFSIDQSNTATFLDPTNPDYGLVPYSTAEASLDNEAGKDHFYDRSETPAYAYGYLLTAVLSADYEDQTGNGISDDDTGTAIKFNYTRESHDYAWRSVISNNGTKAKYADGNRADHDDDKAMYSHGTKEIWYPHSIESRTMLAQFITKDREDGYSVDENGIVYNDTGNSETNERQHLRALDKIQLYTKSEIARAKAATVAPVPLKSVYFDYEYSLCGNTPNSKAATGGKLTLKSLWFTFGNSEAGRLHPYKF
ncbi:MAG: hypothetical protein AAGJ93_17805, partial [Bacteroidota bacterium]